MQIVECVPNFSEGRNADVIKAITREIQSVDDVTLLDADMGYDTNRTVVTFIGTPEKIVDAAFLAIKKAAELIDMSKHSGAHARMGATDVCPFIPVSGITMEQCVKLSKQLAKRVGSELNIPVYLYEYAARSPERNNLAVIREGEYEGLKTKIVKPEWKPDFGPAEFNERSGATVIGAREFLIAYNINLNTPDKKLAKEIAFSIREKGRFKRDEKGKIVRDEKGKKIRVPGTLKAVKAVGWYIDEYKQAQISVNLINYKITPLHKLFEETKKQAEAIGCRVTGSELVGLIPKEAMLQTGKFYLEKQQRSTGIPEEDIITVAEQSLGLSSVQPFEKHQKIIEYRLDIDNELVSKRVDDFVHEVSRSSPAPGGGSVAALAGSLGCALTSMVANLTCEKKGYEDLFNSMVTTATKAQTLKDKLAVAVDSDTSAFNDVIAAKRLPKKTDVEKEIRLAAIQAGFKKAAQVPLETAKLCLEILDHTKIVAQKGNPASITDAGVAALMATAGVQGAVMNVLVNLNTIEDQSFNTNIRQECEEIEQKSLQLNNEIQEIVRSKI